MTKDHVTRLCDEFRQSLSTHEWDFEALGFIERAQEHVPPELAIEIQSRLLTVWIAWYCQWTLRNSPVFDP